jgi:hypothetical protein
VSNGSDDDDDDAVDVTMEIQNPPNNAKEVISPTAADRAVVV